MAFHVMHLGGAPGAIFRRSVRDQNGNILRTLEFPQGKSVEVSKDDLEAIRKDLGNALHVCECHTPETDRVIYSGSEAADKVAEFLNT
jgi:hypothetical protein